MVEVASNEIGVKDTVGSRKREAGVAGHKAASQKSDNAA